MGVSGGEEGARNGPSLMPGGPKDAVESLMPILEKIAAKTDSGPCTTYIGGAGSGNYVKMVSESFLIILLKYLEKLTHSAL